MVQEDRRDHRHDPPRGRAPRSPPKFLTPGTARARATPPSKETRLASRGAARARAPPRAVHAPPRAPTRRDTSRRAIVERPRSIADDRSLARCQALLAPSEARDRTRPAMRD